jgi:hypothetical protein
VSDIIAKVEALIARTESSSEEEARTSALIACRLMKKHGLKVVATGSVARSPAPEPPPPPRKPWEASPEERARAAQEFDERMREIFRCAGNRSYNYSARPQSFNADDVRRAVEEAKKRWRG